MNLSTIDLFHWLLTNYTKATYNFAFSNISGLTLKEYENITGFSIQKNFDLGKNEHYGSLELKETLQLIYNCEQKSIVTTTGGTEANYLVFNAILSKNDEFIIEQPSYPPMWQTPLLLEAKKINWHRQFENNYQLDIETLKKLITKKTKLIILTNIHNPSGVLAKKDEIKAVSDIATDHKIYVLIDEIFLDGSFQKQQSSFNLPNIITTSSMTKIYGLGGLRTGWIIAPPNIALTCQTYKAHTNAASSYLSEILSSNALQNARQNLIKRYKKRAKTNLVLLKKWLKQYDTLMDFVEPNGGIICFPRYNNKNISSQKLCQKLLNDYKILVIPGYYFNQEGHIRISYGEEPQIFQKGLITLGEGLQKIL